MIKVRVNGSEEVNFLIDTGASEVIIDSEFAREKGVHPLSSQTGTYDGLFAGAFPLENVLGFSIGGIISHGFFRHYALTFDFVGMRLFLKRKKGSK